MEHSLKYICSAYLPSGSAKSLNNLMMKNDLMDRFYGW